MLIYCKIKKILKVNCTGKSKIDCPPVSAFIESVEGDLTSKMT